MKLVFVTRIVSTLTRKKMRGRIIDERNAIFKSNKFEQIRLTKNKITIFLFILFISCSSFVVRYFIIYLCIRSTRRAISIPKVEEEEEEELQTMSSCCTFDGQCLKGSANIGYQPRAISLDSFEIERAQWWNKARSRAIFDRKRGKRSGSSSYY